MGGIFKAVNKGSVKIIAYKKSSILLLLSRLLFLIKRLDNNHSNKSTCQAQDQMDQIMKQSS